MKTASGTKIFGITVKADPKMILGGLALLVAAAVWYSMHGDSEEVPPGTPVSHSAAVVPAPVSLVRAKGRAGRRATSGDMSVLRITPVDASDGSIDPTLRMDLLERLQTVEPLTPGRSLFEAGAEAPVTAQVNVPSPIVHVNTQPPPPSTPPAGTVAAAEPSVNIPLKYYGFVNPASKQEAPRGLFLSGDSILVAKEGDELEGRFLVVALNPNHARMEDVQVHQGQVLPVAPEAVDQ